jgi:hypothetical protein
LQDLISEESEDIMQKVITFPPQEFGDRYVILAKFLGSVA